MCDFLCSTFLCCWIHCHCVCQECRNYCRRYHHIRCVRQFTVLVPSQNSSYDCRGYTGLQLLTQIVIADNTTLKWRGLVSGLMSAPFIVNAFVSANISANVLSGAGWRWGCKSCCTSYFKRSSLHLRRNVRDSGSHFPSPSDRNPFVGGAEDKKGEYGPSCKPTENTYR